jgi:hypothetical protein
MSSIGACDRNGSANVTPVAGVDTDFDIVVDDGHDDYTANYDLP